MDPSSLGMIKYLENTGNELKKQEGLILAAMELKRGPREECSQSTLFSVPEPAWGQRLLGLAKCSSAGRAKNVSFCSGICPCVLSGALTALQAGAGSLPVRALAGRGHLCKGSVPCGAASPALRAEFCTLSSKKGNLVAFQ